MYVVNSVSCFFPVFISGMMVGGWSTGCIFYHSLFFLLSHSRPSHHRRLGKFDLTNSSGAWVCYILFSGNMQPLSWICVHLYFANATKGWKSLPRPWIHQKWPCCQSSGLQPSTAVLLVLLKQTGLTSTQQWH